MNKKPSLKWTGVGPDMYSSNNCSWSIGFDAQRLCYAGKESFILVDPFENLGYEHNQDGDDGCDNSADFFSFKVIFQIYPSLTVPTFRDNSEDLFGCGNNKMPFKFNNDESEEGLGVDESSSGLDLLSYKAFYAMAVIGVVSFVFRIIERRNQRGGEPYYSAVYKNSKDSSFIGLSSLGALDYKITRSIKL
ncbi:hypothetical protein L1887_39037 [Cichorium endivia]|nr:hypothetical protein L1887_39037 [Cichorium endivia]